MTAFTQDDPRNVSMTDFASTNKDAGAYGIAGNSLMRQIIMTEAFRQDTVDRTPDDPCCWPCRDADDAVTDTAVRCLSSCVEGVKLQQLPPEMNGCRRVLLPLLYEALVQDPATGTQHWPFRDNDLHG